MTAAKEKAAGPKLTPGTEAVFRYLQITGDSLSGMIEGERHYWAFTRSGLPVRESDIARLKKAKLIEPFAGSIDDRGSAACYVLTKGAETIERTGCGAKSIFDCNGPGLCVDCAPAGLYARMTPAERKRRWKGPKP